MNDLPEGWTASTLGQLGRYLNGRGFKKSEWASAGRPIIRIQNLTGSGTEFNYFAGEAQENYIARPGDLLVSWAATLGAYFWNGPEAVVNQHIFKVESNIDLKFHKYLLDFHLEDLVRQTHGSGIVHITRSKFDAVPVAVPPIVEQRHIVCVLEDHLSRLDVASELLRQVGPRLRSLREASLVRLAADARLMPLSDLLAEPLSNGRSVTTRPGGFPVLRLTALAGMRLNLEERKDGNWTAAEAQPFQVRRGDFMVARGNGSLALVGAGALVADEPDPVAFPDTMIRVRVRPDLLHTSVFAQLWSSRFIRSQIEARARTTAGIYKINQKDLASVLVPVPPVEAQLSLLDEVETQDAAVSAVARSADLAVQQAQSLRRSLLSAAFSGRLTSRLRLDALHEEPVHV